MDAATLTAPSPAQADDASPVSDLSDPALRSLLPESIGHKYQAVALRRDNGELIIGMVTPGDLRAVDDLRALLGERFTRVAISETQFADLIGERRKLDQEVSNVAQIVVDDSFDEQQDLASLRAVVEEAPIVKFVNLIILQAVQERASDIHVEPTEHDLRIRYRIDGVLHERMRQPRSIIPGVISRLKVMADIDIAERRVPKDGRISLTVDGAVVDLRVSTLPTVHGEKIVMRILDRASSVQSLANLGFLPSQLEQYEQSFRKPYGAILVTGPTGSGKTTTLYATLNLLNVESRNIVTVEDPVEYRLANVNQVQTNPKAGLTFANALRSILRQDPDIILVGEIRDRETGVIAIEAALTGHLVLTTLHTNDAPSTPLRLIEMGIEPFLVTSAVDCVLAQRLARRLCDRCKVPFEPTELDLTAAKWDFSRRSGEGLVFYRGVGCPQCGGTGYRGRMAIHEVMPMSEELDKLVVARASSEDVRRVAVDQGLMDLRSDGLAKVALGLTTLSEVSRVVA